MVSRLLTCLTAVVLTVGALSQDFGRVDLNHAKQISDRLLNLALPNLKNIEEPEIDASSVAESVVIKYGDHARAIFRKSDGRLWSWAVSDEVLSDGALLTNRELEDFALSYLKLAGYDDDVQFQLHRQTKNREAKSSYLTGIWSYKGLIYDGLQHSVNFTLESSTGQPINMRIDRPGDKPSNIEPKISRDQALSMMATIAVNNAKGRYLVAPQRRFQLGLLGDHTKIKDSTDYPSILIYRQDFYEASVYDENQMGSHVNYRVVIDAVTGNLVYSLNMPFFGETVKPKPFNWPKSGSLIGIVVKNKTLWIPRSSIKPLSSRELPRAKKKCLIAIDKGFLMVSFSAKQNLIWFNDMGKTVFGRPSKELSKALSSH